jgi:hypothetical protein
VNTAPVQTAGNVSWHDQPWAASAEQIEGAFVTDLRAGLSTAEANRRLASVGRNELDEGHRTRAWMLLTRQFGMPAMNASSPATHNRSAKKWPI